MAPITLIIDNFNLENVTVLLIREITKLYPDISRKEVANKLGIHERTIYRLQHKYDLGFAYTQHRRRIITKK